MAKGTATSSAALMAKEWCLWLGERSELTGRLVCARAGRSGTERDGAGRSGTERDGAGRSGTERDGAGRSGTERDGAGRSGTERDGALAFAASARLRRVVSIIALIAFVLLPRPPLYHIPGNRQARESAAICGNLRRLAGRSAARAPTLPATPPPRQRSRGSSRSRDALPTMFRPSTTKARSGTASRHHDAGPGSPQVPQNGVTPMGSITQHRAGRGE